MHQGKKYNLVDRKRLVERMLNAKKHNEAIEILKDIISKYSDWLSPYLMLSNALYEKAETEKALEILLKAAYLKPFNLVLKKRIIKLYLDCSNRESAREMLGEVALLFPRDEWIKTAMEELKSPFVTKTMAKLYEKQGYIEDAHRIYEKLAASRKERKSDADSPR
jgi:tetratricopeptide (TPR) repeat protein